MGRARTLARDAKALQLRLEGETFDSISTKLKFGSRAHAYEAVKRQLDSIRETCVETAQEVLAQELMRLDEMLVAIGKKVRAGDLQAIDRALKIQDRRASYLGLDTPKSLKVELAREVGDFLDRVRMGCTPDVYQQVLSVVTGLDSEAAAPGLADGAGAPEK